MAKRNKQSSEAAGPSSSSAPFNNALAGLASLKAELGGAGDEPEAPADPGDDPEPPPSSASAAYVLKGKLAVHKEKKGRGGKTATRISGLNLGSDALQALARDMKKQLGCSALVEGDDVVLLGDLTDRAAQWLRAHGAKRVV